LHPRFALDESRSSHRDAVAFSETYDLIDCQGTDKRSPVWEINPAVVSRRCKDSRVVGKTAAVRATRQKCMRLCFFTGTKEALAENIMSQWRAVFGVHGLQHLVAEVSVVSLTQKNDAC
jgi:hypothetical protein